MENLVIIKPDDLRQLIRDELSNLTVAKDQPTTPSQPITTKQLCAFLGITEPTIIRWRQKGKIPYMQIGSLIRYNKQEVLDAISKRRKGVQK